MSQGTRFWQSWSRASARECLHFITVMSLSKDQAVSVMTLRVAMTTDLVFLFYLYLFFVYFLTH